MTFPQTPLGIKVEILLNGVWTNITSYVYQRDPLNIVRGRRSEGSTADPSTLTFTLNNRDGRFSPRNPNGVYYGLIGRNTRVRVSLTDHTISHYLFIPNIINSGATCPDTVGISITGDIDIRFDAWFGSTYSMQELIGKYSATGNQRSWELMIQSDNTVWYRWSPDGTTTVDAFSTVPIPAPISKRVALRVTHQVNNGAGGNTVTFYTSDTIAGTWTQLGAPVITAGTTSIFDSTTPLYIGDIAGTAGGVNVASSPGVLKVYGAKVLSGIAGVEKANPDFTTQADGATSFSDAAGNTWTINPSAFIVGANYRFYGEISEWPSRWDITGKDIYVPVTSSGILRRLTNSVSGKRIKSAYFRSCTSAVAPVTALQAYWPCEDSVGSTSIASAFSGQPGMSISGTPTFANDSTSFLTSSPLPNIGTASFTGKVNSYTSTGQIQVKFLLAIPSTGIANNCVMFSLRCGGTAARWEIVYTTASGGTITVNAYDTFGNNILTSSNAFSLTGTITRLCLALTQNGPNVDWSVSGLSPGFVNGGSLFATLAANTITTATQVVLGANGDMNGATVGHVTVQSVVTGTFDLTAALNAYIGETGAQRFSRLCGEEGIISTVSGITQATGVMGAQLPMSLPDLLHECETTDDGIIYETRDFFGLGYRGLKSLLSQAANLTLDYSLADLSTIEPIEDDRLIVNDMTASRTSGSSYRYVQSTGRMSTQDPPNGIGIYDNAIQVNTSTDNALGDVASWYVHTGTVDEPRFPTLSIMLSRSNYVNNSTKTAAASALDVGDRIAINNPPSWMPPEAISQIAIGITETLNAFVWDIGFVCQPESPFHVAIYNDSGSRYSTAGSTLYRAHSSVETTLLVNTLSVPAWGFGDGSYDIMVSGERMTVTGVSNAQSIFADDFEIGISNWTSAPVAQTLAWATSQKHGGTHSLKMTTVASTLPRVEGPLASVTPVRIYAAGGWLFCQSAVSVELGINWYDANSVFISRSTQAIVVAANTWTQFSASYTSPSNATQAGLYAGVSGVVGNGVVLYVDDVNLFCSSDTVPQGLTVTRSVNGIVKSHSLGETVQLANPVYWGM